MVNLYFEINYNLPLYSTQPKMIHKGLMYVLMKIKNNTLKIYLFFLLLAMLSGMPTQNGLASTKMQQEQAIYVVQSGDSLNTIALRFGVTSEEIQSANNIADINALSIGQQLIIPGLEGISGLLTSEVLEYGTSLTGLSRQFGSKKDDLIYLNRLSSPSETIAGITFIIPVIETKTPLSPAHTVSPRQTTLEYAIKTESSPWGILTNNQLMGTWDLLPGEKLFVSSETIASSLLPLPNITNLSFNNFPIIQGETLELKITTSGQVELSGELDGEQLFFFTENNNEYYSFHGIHSMMDPGVYPLKIETTLPDGEVMDFEQLVFIEAGGYGNEWVFVDEKYLDKDAIAEEDAYVNPILNQFTPEKYWEGRFQYPVDEPCINSLFGQRRDYNNGVLFFYHTGMDFGVCAPNLNIYAPAAGEVVLAEELFVKGRAILIDHGWGVFSGYWHLSEFNVSIGDFVQAGDLLGQIGSTGRSAGPHLHFEIDISGTPVNPLTWLSQEFP
jgi:murein DD-endopeptidase MepM/ murein hydrolase activator NlpD